jgi:predicted permease
MKVRLHSDVLWKEASTALRNLQRDRGFAIFSLILLALGIGLTSGVFTLLWQAIYAQLPVSKPQELFTLTTNVTHMGRSEGDADAQSFSFPMYRYLAEHAKASDGLIARRGEMLNLDAPGGPEHVLGEFVSGTYFAVLGVKPVLGRAFQESDDSRSGEHVGAVLSYDMWQHAYGASLSAWNSTLRVNGVPFRVIGVTPPGFKGLVAGQAPKLFLPLSAYGDLNPGWHEYADWGLRWLNIFVRVREVAKVEAAQADLQNIYANGVRQELATEGPQAPEYLRELQHEHMQLVPAAKGVHAMLDQWNEPLRILQWMTLAVLLLVAVNVVGLMLVRAMRKRQDLLIRYAVGASRWQVMRLQIMEALLLSCLAGAFALWVARTSAEVLAHLARMDRSQAFLYTPYGWLLIFHWAIALGIGLAIGALAAWKSARLDLSQALSEGIQTHSGTRSQAFARRMLGAAQIALSLTLAVAAGLFAVALHKLVSVPVGFDPEHLTVFSVDPKLAKATIQGTELLWERIANRLGHEPGVRSVTYGTGGPFPQEADMAVLIPSPHVSGGVRQQGGTRSIIGPAYFRTLGIAVIRGREFGKQDRANTPSVIIVNEVMAHKLFGGGDAIGQTVTVFNGLDRNWTATVIGVVADHHQSWRRATAPLIYTPALQISRISDMTFYVRTSTGSLPEQAIRKIVHSEAPSIGAYDIATMKSLMSEFASGERAMTMLVFTFACLALTVAAVGVYGVVSYGTSLRKLEFGVRVCVGATPSQIVRIVLGEAIIVLIAGVLVGTPLTYLGFLLIRSQVQTAPLPQGEVFAGALAILAACSIAAALPSMGRAARIEVHEALRHS